MTLIPPYDHPDVIAGQGTAAKELIEEVGALDALFVCLGGGGLLSRLGAGGARAGARVQGLRRRARGRQRRPAVVAQRPRSCTSRRRSTIADGAQTQHLGELHLRRSSGATSPTSSRSSDAQLVDAMRFFAERMKMVVEPTGCLGFAAARRMAARACGQRVGVIVSGGNVDLARFAALVGTGRG